MSVSLINKEEVSFACYHFNLQGFLIPSKHLRILFLQELNIFISDYPTNIKIIVTSMKKITQLIKVTMINRQITSPSSSTGSSLGYFLHISNKPFKYWQNTTS